MPLFSTRVVDASECPGLNSGGNGLLDTEKWIDKIITPDPRVSFHLLKQSGVANFH